MCKSQTQTKRVTDIDLLKNKVKGTNYGDTRFLPDSIKKKSHLHCEKPLLLALYISIYLHLLAPGNDLDNPMTSHLNLHKKHTLK